MSDILTARVLNATPEAIFACFSDPERLARWWGPEGFSNRFEEFDFRPGGIWRFTMRSPKGAEYANQSEFLEVAPPAKVVIKHVSAPHFVLTITLTRQDVGTLLRWQMGFSSPAELDKVKGFAPAANEQNLDRLEAELAREG